MSTNGYLSDGSGPEGAAYGRDPSTATPTNPLGRAYKRNGTVRKARTIKTVDQQMADIADAERKAQGTIGRKAAAGIAMLSVFNVAFATFKSWVSEAKRKSNRDARRAALEAQLAQVDADADMADAFLEAQGSAIEQANGVYSEIGKAYFAFQRENGRGPTEEEAAEIVGNVVDAEAIASVEAASDPENDPFESTRRGAASESDDSDDLLD